MHHWVFLNFSGNPFFDFFIYISRFGWVGVDLFFLLSGFLISSILFRTRTSAEYFKNFWGRRALRILPLYYGFLAVFLIIIPSFEYFDHWKSFGSYVKGSWWYWAFLSNYSEGLGYTRHQFLIVSWSLSIEENFYLMWPLILWRYRPPTVFRISLFLIPFSFLTRQILLFPLHSEPFLVQWQTPCRLEGLCIGACFAYIYRYWNEADLKRLGSRLLRLLPITFLGVFIAAYLHTILVYRGNVPTKPDEWSVTYGILFANLFFANLFGLILFSTRGSCWLKILRWKPLADMGKYTFSLYLLHLPLYYALMTGTELWGSGFRQNLTLDWVVVHLTAFFICLAVCAALYHTYEKPFLSLKSYFSYKKGKVEVKEK